MTVAQGTKVVNKIIAFEITLKYPHCFQISLAMTIQDLQQQLRVHIRARIGRGELTGTALAGEAALPQGHLSNFLNARRGLSVESMDRLLEALRISVLDLVNREEWERRERPRRNNGLEAVVVVAPEHAGEARFRADHILGARAFSKTFLRKLKPRMAADRSDWRRFVVIRLSARDARGFFPRPLTTTLLVDRHYNSLEPYRRLQPNLYAVRLAGECIAAQISVCDNCLLLRPRQPRQPIEIVRISFGESYFDYIIGRICHVGLEV